VFLVVNKCDNFERLMNANEFYSLGFENMFSLSAMTGSGTGEVLDALVELIPDELVEKTEENIPKVCIIGQPNVGKSSLVNALLGEDRNIVTNIAGTTRDSIHTLYSKFDKKFWLIDTAGIRRKAKVHEDLEFYSVIRAVKAVDESDVAVVVFDATTELSQQDLTIFRMAVKKKRGIIICINKWDLVKKDDKTILKFEDELKRKLAPFNDIPLLFISALEKQRIFKLVDMIEEIYGNMNIKIPTAKLNEIMLKEIERYHPPAVSGKLVTIKYITQIPSRTPTFAFFANHPKYIGDSYKHFLENQLRKHFPLKGVPISIIFREK